MLLVLRKLWVEVKVEEEEEEEEEANYEVDQGGEAERDREDSWSHDEKIQPNDEAERVKDWQREKHKPCPDPWNLEIKIKE